MHGPEHGAKALTKPSPYRLMPLNSSLPHQFQHGGCDVDRPLQVCSAGFTSSTLTIWCCASSTATCLQDQDEDLVDRWASSGWLTSWSLSLDDCIRCRMDGPLGRAPRRCSSSPAAVPLYVYKAAASVSGGLAWASCSGPWAKIGKGDTCVAGPSGSQPLRGLSLKSAFQELPAGPIQGAIQESWALGLQRKQTKNSHECLQQVTSLSSKMPLKPLTHVFAAWRALIFFLWSRRQIYSAARQHDRSELPITLDKSASIRSESMLDIRAAALLCRRSPF